MTPDRAAHSLAAVVVVPSHGWGFLHLTALDCLFRHRSNDQLAVIANDSGDCHLIPNDLKAVVAVVVRGGSGRMELCICSFIIWIEC